MTGRAEPSHEELRSSIQKRLVSLDEWDGLEKRYNRKGTKTKGVKGLKPIGKIGATGGKNGTANSQTAQTGSQVSGAAQKGSTKSGSAAAQSSPQVGSGNGGQRKQGKQTKGTQQGATTSSTQTAPVKLNQAAANPGVSPAKIEAFNSGSVTKAEDPATADSLGLDIESGDVGYLATIQMGTPPQNFLLLMDSGSADLWVGAEGCQSQAGGGCGKHTFLGNATSSSFQDTQQPFAITYGTGQVQGNIVSDDIVVAGLQLPAHKFGVATVESVDFSDDGTPFDGIMGLAQSALSEQKTLTPIEALAQAGLVRQAIMSYKISRVEDKLNDGEITFGGTDATKFDATTVETLKNVNAQGFWEASMPAVSVDGVDIGLNGRTAVLDTGTTLIIAPADDALAIHQQIPGAQSDGQGGFVIPCTTTSEVALTFGNTAFTIDPRDLVFAPLDPADPAGDCVSGISSGNIGGATEWLVGDVFLKNAYFSTDVTKNQLSLAKLK
ncbi:hypothetical protein ONZ45_g12289 [Pleurotus djamor]|nr:hypothetical protein ONZ45_g12289 [Pleurotus djamor]